MLIRIDIHSFWRSGTGAGETGGVDALCAVDQNGLPYLPGKHLKGLLRNAVRQAIDFGHVKGVTVETLFGERGFDRDGDEIVPYSRAEPGCLRVDSAHLSKMDRDAIIASDNAEGLVKQLFRNVQSTAMDENTGAAKDKSLRLEQVAVPMVLEFSVTRLAGNEAWENALEMALPLIRTVGQKRTRGLGRAVLRVVS